MQQTQLSRAGVDDSNSHRLSSQTAAVEHMDPEDPKKQKVTLYFSTDLYHQFKIRAAMEQETMSAMAEKALHFLLEHPDVVDGMMGRTHQLHHCPECRHPFVMKDGEPTSAQSFSQSNWILEDGWESAQQVQDEQDELVPC